MYNFGSDNPTCKQSRLLSACFNRLKILQGPSFQMRYGLGEHSSRETDKSSYRLANLGTSVEQNTGIIVASMPSLRQFFTVVKKQHSSRHSHSSEKPFRRGSPFIASPLSPSTDNTQSDHIPSLDSPVSTVAEKMEKQQDADKGNNSSPTMSIVSRFRPMSFSGEKVHGVNGHQDAEAKECNAKDCNKDWEQRRESRPTLGNHAILGYSCKIEGGSSNLTA